MAHPTVHIEHFFYWLGYRIGKHHVKIIIGTLIFTSLLSAGMVNFEENNNVRSEYSPLNAPSQKEYEVARTFLKQVRYEENFILRQRCTSSRDGNHASFVRLVTEKKACP